MPNPTFSVDKQTVQKTDVAYLSTGGTVTGAHVLEVSYLAANFPARKDLLIAIDAVKQKLIESTWPPTDPV